MTSSESVTGRQRHPHPVAQQSGPKPAVVGTAPGRARADAVEPPSLTPELVLVSPDLAPLARALLPDRPWERTWVPAAPAATVGHARGVREPSRPAIIPPTTAKRGRPWVRALVASNVVGLIVFVALVVMGSTLPPRDAPSLAPGPARDQGLPTSALGASTVMARRATTRQGTPKTRSAAAPDTDSAKTSRPARIVRNPGLQIQTNRAGRMTARFAGVVPCAGKVMLANIGVSSTGRFSVRRQLWTGRAQVVVSLGGRVRILGAVRGTVQARREDCDSGSIDFATRATSG